MGVPFETSSLSSRAWTCVCARARAFVCGVCVLCSLMSPVVDASVCRSSKQACCQGCKPLHDMSHRHRLRYVAYKVIQHVPTPLLACGVSLNVGRLCFRDVSIVLH